MNSPIDRILARMPKATPVLKGRDAVRFVEAMRNTKPVSREEYLRAKAIFDAVSRPK